MVSFSASRASSGPTEPDRPPAARKRVLWWWFALLGVGLLAWIGGFAAGWSVGPLTSTDQRASDDELLGLAEPRIDSALAPQYRSMLQEARVVVRNLLKVAPESAEVMSAAARLHDLAHDTEGERRCWERCLQLDPGNVEAFLRLGNLAMGAGQYEKAVSLMQEALGAATDTAEFHTILADALMNLGRLEQAKKVLDDFLRKEPQSVAGRFLLGHVYLRLKKNEEAKQQFEQVVKIQPTHTNAYHGLATVCARLGQQTEAESYRQRFEALKEAENQAQRQKLGTFVDRVIVPQGVSRIFTTAGQIYMALENDELAEQHLLIAASLDKGNVECRRLLAQLYDRQARYRDALPVVLELRRLEPGNTIHHRNVGILYARLNQFDQAEAAFQNICMVAPRNALGYSALAELYLGAGRKLDQAERLAEKAIALRGSAKDYFLLGTICKETGNMDRARSLLKKALEQQPNNPLFKRAYDSLAVKHSGTAEQGKPQGADRR